MYKQIFLFLTYIVLYLSFDWLKYLADSETEIDRNIIRYIHT